jgi:hypothetical protein
MSPTEDPSDVKERFTFARSVGEEQHTTAITSFHFMCSNWNSFICSFSAPLLFFLTLNGKVQ